MVTTDFRDFVLEQLRRASRATITHRAMFGGVGVYAEGLFFAIMADDLLYFKVDDETRPAFEARGMGPFLPYDDPARPMRGYWQLPGEVLEEPTELEAWVADAVAVARRAKK
ncbi:MAG: TfoX/Sxy family protein [Gemmatimonadetes bacterium]|nr:TfoX/Sxy family protein [Gemmatimonadota bacterium]